MWPGRDIPLPLMAALLGEGEGRFFPSLLRVSFELKVLSNCKGEVETSSQLGLADQKENRTFVDHTLAVKETREL